MNYKLRCSLYGHTSDVRALTTLDSCIISGSRDETTKLWTENGTVYEQTTILSGHTKYVSAVTLLPPTDAYPFGLIVTGSHDNKINGYIPYTEDPVITMQGHDAPVVSLATSIQSNCVLSASWDKTAKIWDISTGHVIVSLIGHSEAVWCVIDIPECYIITASADKTLKVFSTNGSCVTTISGHTDCVRGVTYLGESTIMSCANDGTLRKWHVPTGLLLDKMDVHNNYIYSVAVDLKSGLFAFVGENHILSVWTEEAKDKRQVIYHPATSVWSVALLPNSDIVTGSSDGYIRIFTKDPSRYASKEERDEFDKETLAKMTSNSTARFPGKEAISGPGAFDGEVKIISDSGKNCCYSWSDLEQKWKLLDERSINGNVQNGDKDTQTDSGNKKVTKRRPPKQTYNGKRYDYVFSVDIEDGKEPLKLPFNRNQDPKAVAQKFIIEHSLNPDFLEKIVSFLLENAGLASSRNKPSTSSSSKSDEVIYESRNFYPPDNYVFFEQHDLKLIFKKLEEYMLEMGRQPEEIIKVQEALKSLVEGKLDSVANGLLILFEAVETWPEGYVFPVLDIARIICRKKVIHEVLFDEENAPKFLAALDRFFSPKALANNKMFLFRILSNMFTGSQGEKLIFSHKSDLLPKLSLLLDVNMESHKGLEVAMATFVVNMSLASLRTEDFLAVRLCYDFILNVIIFIKDEEAIFRFLVALGTIGIVEGAEILHPHIRSLLNDVSGWDESDSVKRKAAYCAMNILEDVDTGEYGDMDV